jgi:hypothetical protein
VSNLDRVNRLWLDYREKVIPRNAPSDQILECRRAFYGGAWALWTETQLMLDTGDDETHDDLMKAALIDQELRRFNEQVKRGVA